MIMGRLSEVEVPPTDNSGVGAGARWNFTFTLAQVTSDPAVQPGL